jgi:hypothetical protein
MQPSLLNNSNSFVTAAFMLVSHGCHNVYMQSLYFLVPIIQKIIISMLYNELFIQFVT